MEQRIFNTFASCKLVKGHQRAVILDLQRNKIYPIPLTLYTILQFAGKMSVPDLIQTYGVDNREVIEEYFKFLTENDIVFFSDRPELYPSLDDAWDEPFEITNCILDFDAENISLASQVYISIGSVPIKALQIRVFEAVSIEDLDALLKNIKPIGTSSIELIVKYSTQMSPENLRLICNQNPYLFMVTVFDAPVQRQHNFGKSAFGQVFYVTEPAVSEKSCGRISPDFFTINMKTFTESLRHNSCLNRKVSVDRNGEIKNCPSMVDSYGNVRDTSFRDALELPGFKKYWGINKDMISGCKDCEFRYVCTDCRAYTEDPEDLLSKPLKCGYNPYTGEWADWKVDADKSIAMGFYELNPIDFSALEMACP